MIEAALRSLLLHSPLVAELVGTRVQPQAHHETTPLEPSIAYWRAEGDPVYCLSGTTSGLVRARYLVECRASTYEAVKNLADYARRALDGFKGRAAAEDINWIQWQSDADSYTPPQDGSGRGQHFVGLEFDIWYGIEPATALVAAHEIAAMGNPGGA